MFIDSILIIYSFNVYFFIIHSFVYFIESVFFFNFRTKMICKDTLIIKNLPPELSDTEKKDLLTHFGAINVKIITSKYKQKSKAFVKFESEEIAKNVLLRLHQMNILDSRLCVEYAEQEIGCDKMHNSLKDLEEGTKHFNTFLSKLNSWNIAVSFHQPPPPHLKYQYPKPNRATINNIAHALAAIPKFYTQVLHLMNKMNLPPPFSNIPDPPEPVQQNFNHQQQQQPQQQQAPPPPPSQKQDGQSSSESELESDPETQKSADVIPMKRKKPQKKVVKKPKFIKPTTVVSTSKTVQNTEDVFEKVDLQNQKKIELKVSENLEPKETTNENEEIEGFGIMPSQRPKTPEDEEMKDADANETNVEKIITEEELAANRISPKDFGVLPVFKDYHAGAPSCRLYIKNLSKNVDVKDLQYIYKRYEIASEECEQGNMFDIRLLSEGRMKGQAFVTLQSVAQAQKAVKETNGFILKNKPLVVVFARSAVPKSK